MGRCVRQQPHAYARTELEVARVPEQCQGCARGEHAPHEELARHLRAVRGVVVAAEVEVLGLDGAQVRVGEELQRARADVGGGHGLAVVDLVGRGWWWD